jgi:glycerol-3-phosphate dehydrogenase
MVDLFNTLLRQKEQLKGYDVRAEVRDGDILWLEGMARTWTDVVAIGHLAASVPGVRQVVNHLRALDENPPVRDRAPIIAAGRAVGEIDEVDVLIIGGGITGCAAARSLSKYDLRILVVEKCSDIGEGNTKSNNGMIHSGYDSKHGTLKARLNVEGNAKYDRWAKELGFKFCRTGSFVAGFDENDRRHMEAFLENGRKNGVPGIAIISGDEARRIAPYLSDEIQFALWTPSAGYVEPQEVTLALAENAIDNGARILLDTEVGAIDVSPGRPHRVITNRGVIVAHSIINAAGIYADEIAAMAGDEYYTIHPRRGTLVILDKNYKGRLVQFVGTTPANHTKGGGPTQTPEGNPLWGPSAIEVPDKEDYAVDADDIGFIMEKGFKLTKGFTMNGVITYFSGTRASTYKEDFIIEPSRKVENFIHVAGMQSPAVASAPAVADMVEDIFVKMHPGLREKADYNPYRTPPKEFRHCTPEEREALIREDPLFGHVVCRCETVTEAEIVRAIHGKVPARTMDAVKRRTRAGMGRCQGGFCCPRVIDIMARELNISPLEVTKNGPGSEMLYALSRVPEEVCAR